MTLIYQIKHIMTRTTHPTSGINKPSEAILVEMVNTPQEEVLRQEPKCSLYESIGYGFGKAEIEYLERKCGKEDLLK